MFIYIWGIIGWFHKIESSSEGTHTHTQIHTHTYTPHTHTHTHTPHTHTPHTHTHTYSPHTYWRKYAVKCNCKRKIWVLRDQTCADGRLWRRYTMICATAHTAQRVVLCPCPVLTPHIRTHKHSSLIAISYDALSSFVAITLSYVRV